MKLIVNLWLLLPYFGRHQFLQPFIANSKATKHQVFVGKMDFNCLCGQGQDWGRRFVCEVSLQLEEKTQACFKCFCRKMSAIGMPCIRGGAIAPIGCIGNSRGGPVRLSARPAGAYSHQDSLPWTPSTPHHASFYQAASVHTCLASNVWTLNVKSTEGKDESAEGEVRMETTKFKRRGGKYKTWRGFACLFQSSDLNRSSS